jgi:hypothetical protein
MLHKDYDRKCYVERNEGTCRQDEMIGGKPPDSDFDITHPNPLSSFDYLVECLIKFRSTQSVLNEPLLKMLEERAIPHSSAILFSTDETSIRVQTRRGSGSVSGARLHFRDTSSWQLDTITRNARLFLRIRMLPEFPTRTLARLLGCQRLLLERSLLWPQCHGLTNMANASELPTASS